MQAIAGRVVCARCGKELGLHDLAAALGQKGELKGIACLEFYTTAGVCYRIPLGELARFAA